MDKYKNIATIMLGSIVGVLPGIMSTAQATPPKKAPAPIAPWKAEDEIRKDVESYKEVALIVNI